MTNTFRALEIPSAELEEYKLALPGAEPLSGEILARNRILYESDDKRITTGTWECDPGVSRWEFTASGEFIHVISGRMTVERDGNAPVELTEGATAVFPIGWKGTWTVHEKLRKVFVVYEA